MTERVLPWFPVTFERPPGLTWIAHEARFVDDPVDGQWVIIDDGNQGRQYKVGAVQAMNENELRWESPTGGTYLIRPTRPDDAAVWDFGLRIPLPTDIIGAILTGSIALPTISAAVDDTGDVHTIILETGVGLYARYARTWIRMTDISPIEQLDIVDVPASDLEIYDQADDQGRTVSIRDLNALDTPAVGGVEVTPTAPATPVTAAAVQQVIVASYADLPDAIAYAATDEGQGARWYVGRRAKAFGWTEPLPWDES
jgi:hypothetical protein